MQSTLSEKFRQEGNAVPVDEYIEVEDLHKRRLEILDGVRDGKVFQIKFGPSDLLLLPPEEARRIIGLSDTKFTETEMGTAAFAKRKTRFLSEHVSEHAALHLWKKAILCATVMQKTRVEELLLKSLEASTLEDDLLMLDKYIRRAYEDGRPFKIVRSPSGFSVEIGEDISKTADQPSNEI